MNFNYKKAVQVLNFFATKEGGEINKLKALKLVWLADRLHLRSHGRPIINDSYYAMTHGPVASSTKDIIENNPVVGDEVLEYKDTVLDRDGHNFKSIAEVNTKVFSKTDLDALEEAYTIFGSLPKYQIRDLSHDYPEWEKFKASVERTKSSYEMSYHDFFENNDKSHAVFLKDPELLEIAKELFNENEKIKNIF